MFFDNALIIWGGSDALRSKCYKDLRMGISGSPIQRSSEQRRPEGLIVTSTTTWQPMDNPVLVLAIKYLALDFELEFGAVSTHFDDWEGILYFTDGVVEIQDNKQFLDRTEIGCIYDLKAKGGFPACLGG